MKAFEIRCPLAIYDKEESFLVTQTGYRKLGKLRRVQSDMMALVRLSRHTYSLVEISRFNWKDPWTAITEADFSNKIMLADVLESWIFDWMLSQELRQGHACRGVTSECAICLNNDEAPAHQLPCGHSFHAHCNLKWIEAPLAPLLGSPPRPQDELHHVQAVWLHHLEHL